MKPSFVSWFLNKTFKNLEIDWQSLAQADPAWLESFSAR